MTDLAMADLIERFRVVVAHRLGLALDPAGPTSPGAVLASRLAATALGGEDYLRRLEAAGLDGELGALAQQLTVGETYLFRNAAQFRALGEVALPALTGGRGGGAIRILSAGCASGDEPYSIAIAAREALPAPAWSIAIRAVDANSAMLARARRARYRAWSLRETPDDIRRRYFRAVGRELVLDDAVRGAVSFEHRNLASEDAELWAPASFEVVFCRNVIMYFAPEVQRAVVERIARALIPGGYLFLGHAETLRAISERFELCHSHDAFYYRRCDRDAPARVRAAPAAVPVVVATTSSVLDGDTAWIHAIGQAAERIAALSARPARAAAPAVPAVAAAPAPIDDIAAVMALVGRERFAEALAILDARPAGDEPDVVLLHAMLRVHAGQLDAAEALCRRLLDADADAPPPCVAGAHHVLSLRCEAAGDRRSAAVHGQTAVRADPTFAMPRLHLGLAARRAGDAAAARRELGQALALLERESASRLLLFGGGFDRDALIALCRQELAACGVPR